MAQKKATQKKETVASLTVKVRDLTKRLEAIEGKKEAKQAEYRKDKSIHNVDPNAQEHDNMKLGYWDKVESAKNVAVILNPKLLNDDGRHTPENISAVAGFHIDEQMYEDIYVLLEKQGHYVPKG